MQLKFFNKDLKSIYNKILSDVYLLHYSTNLQMFESRKTEQWLSGHFINWQIFNTPPGYSTTRIPEESFNNQVKEIFT